MSISSEITRISQNVANSLTAVASKGATVPSGSNSDDLPTLIASLPSSKSVTYNLTGGASASVTPSRAIEGQGFSLKLKAPAGYNLSGVTVTMGGVDVTSSVFEYDETGDDGGSSEPVLQTKSVSYTPTTSAQSAQVTADSGYDGLEQVNVSVGAIPSQYIVPSGSQTLTSNDTYDVTSLAEVVVDVPSSGGGAKVATGTYTPPQTYNTTNNRAICAMSDIGFTPSRFIFELDDKTNTAQTQYMVIRASYELLGSAKVPMRLVMRYSNASGSMGSAQSGASWTTQTNYHLYTNGTTVYFRTTSAYILPEGVTYRWTAYE